MEKTYSPDVAKRLLGIKNALLHNDYNEAYHQLYMIASPNVDKHSDEVWEEMEQIASESTLII